AVGTGGEWGAFRDRGICREVEPDQVPLLAALSTLPRDSAMDRPLDRFADRLYHRPGVRRWSVAGGFAQSKDVGRLAGHPVLPRQMAVGRDRLFRGGNFFKEVF